MSHSPRLGGERSLWRALAVTVLSVPFPGIALIRSGRKVTGTLVLLTAWAALGTVAGWLLLADNRDLVRLLLHPDWLAGVAVAAVLAAVAWTSMLVVSYRVARPVGLAGVRRLAGDSVVLLLCAALCAPLAIGARYAYVQHDLVNSIFRHQLGQASGSRQPAQADPWAGRSRVNVLLLGGDAEWNRYGSRTDSMSLASIDTRTGDTVLLSLPRNLLHAPMPPGPMRERFPRGFRAEGGLLNEVYQYAWDHPELAPRGVADPGAELVKQTFAEVLGVPVDYYVLVNLRAFPELVDAVGGVRLVVDQRIPYGRGGQHIEPGRQLLNGNLTTWYARSRTNSDDYTRMRRQRCVLGALVRQADPMQALLSFQELAATAKRNVATDVPPELIAALVDLSGKTKRAAVSSIAFTPPLIRTADPDYPLIRRLAQAAVASHPVATRSAVPSPGDPAVRTKVGPTASPGATAASDGGDGESDGVTGRSNAGDQGRPVSLQEVCQYW